MLARTPIQSGPPHAMSGIGQLLAGGVAAAVVALSVMIGLEVSAATARSGLQLSQEPRGEIVNRKGKGDRLLLDPAHLPDAAHQLRETIIVRTPAFDLKLADGCESLVSSLAHAQLAKVAGRCVS